MIATDVAASVADVAGLAVAPNVSELAVSTRIQSEYANVSDTSSISKPVIVQLSAASRNISSYQVQEGDTVASVAAKFGISEKTLRWANNLKDNDRLAAGATIDILPTDGITYTVKNGDTLEKIAERYKASVAVITTYNDLELNGISTGLKIIVPNGDLPTTERPGYVAPVVNTFIAGYGAGFTGNTWFIKRGTPMYAGNKYAPGNCTAYAYDRRMELGRPLPPSTWGHAATWATGARNAGFLVNRTPAVGAVIQNGGGYGHVAIVEEILPNGDLRLSEMNAAVRGGGLNIVSGRILPAAVAGQYLYIH